MFELYELKPILPVFSDIKKGGKPENALKEEKKCGYDQYLTILKLMY